MSLLPLLVQGLLKMIPKKWPLSIMNMPHLRRQHSTLPITLPNGVDLIAIITCCPQRQSDENSYQNIWKAIANIEGSRISLFRLPWIDFLKMLTGSVGYLGFTGESLWGNRKEGIIKLTCMCWQGCLGTDPSADFSNRFWLCFICTASSWWIFFLATWIWW